MASMDVWSASIANDATVPTGLSSDSGVPPDGEHSIPLPSDRDVLLLAPQLAWAKIKKGPSEGMESDAREWIRVVGPTDLPGLRVR